MAWVCGFDCVCVGLPMCVCLNKPAASCEYFLPLQWIYTVAPPVKKAAPFNQFVDIMIYLEVSF